MSFEERKEKILLAVVNEHIKTGEPVSSLMLSRKYNFKVSSAMIRWDLLELEQEGYLTHLYPSSGRIPTEKAYRFFVNYLLKKELIQERKNRIQEKVKMIENILFKLQEIDEILREFSMISKSHLLWLEENFDAIHESSLSNTLSFFDFEKQDDILSFIKFIEEVKMVKDYILEDFKDKEVAVFIGREFPYEVELKSCNFSLLGIQGSLPKLGRGALLMLGPQRMNYEDNLIMLKKIKEFCR